MRFTFEAHGEKLIEREILRVGNRAADHRPAFEVVARAMMAIEREQFDAEGGRSGGWPALSPHTAAEKTRKGEDPRVLHATLDLMRSLTEQGDSNQLLEIHESWMAFGSHLPYASIHQRGGKNLPQRRPIDFNEADRQGIVKIIQRWLMRGEAAL